MAYLRTPRGKYQGGRRETRRMLNRIFNRERVSLYRTRFDVTRTHTTIPPYSGATRTTTLLAREASDLHISTGAYLPPSRLARACYIARKKSRSYPRVTCEAASRAIKADALPRARTHHRRRRRRRPVVGPPPSGCRSGGRVVADAGCSARPWRTRRWVRVAASERGKSIGKSGWRVPARADSRYIGQR